ncbi:radical SAM protein [Deferribacteres bacterium DY0037]
MSCFNDFELLLFHILKGYDTCASREIIENLQIDKTVVEKFINKLNHEGWMRESRPNNYGGALDAVYVIVSELCNYNCKYCYIQPKINKRNQVTSYIETSIFAKIVEKVANFNPNAQILVTGGEPLLHPEFLKLIEILENRKLNFQVLTNGSKINDEIADKLSACNYLKNVQVSLDGTNDETNEITRGDTFAETVSGVDTLHKYNVPFTIAPTIHDGNVHLFQEMMLYSVDKGGGYTPNNYRKISDSDGSISLDYKKFMEILIDSENNLSHKQRNRLSTRNSQSIITLQSTRNLFCCGTGKSTLNIDMKGNVFPCHLLHETMFLLGNVIEESFASIICNPVLNDIRVHTYDIDECSDCHFMSICGGGCKAAVYKKYGRFDKPDPECSALKYGYELIFTGFPK